MSDQKTKSSGPSWVMVLVIIPVAAYFLLGPFTHDWFLRQEASPSGYAIVAKHYPHLSPQAQETISSRIAKGYLSNEDLDRLMSVMVQETPGGIQTSPAPDFGDERESALAQTIRNLWGQPRESKAKDMLLSLTSR
ncbi:hypothetical protein BLL42_27465 (plasmid) [Pseudomonas frederiksbergensis]|uniref:Uncharacterized protein n=1 Tax=Pseudomonas frederiksbergensis TaxID=104087 RepID=A0A1J0EUK9_9PSED|nr:hypothetical protein [Pseudomonas frederiksbergensis]APC19476.1 hypothetical protein BLL42_27465 [Pseudomonas frederiksbergensis]